ncbi:succinate-semialdehyde mitochondrial isoform X1 [Labeo rohita]|uniref:Succinate-semialdehyde mitochondrial isoform X1 n=1 Tax=Labeo rohita TaxID=84645 RepID=A0A498LPE3_LABRO|nr:succinate-semialdehyde mitochondrial isoform X1 [Labeo rohita]
MEKTRDAISSRFYWPGMEEDIRKWIAQCPECQARRSTLKEKKAYIPIEITEPLELANGFHDLSPTPSDSPLVNAVSETPSNPTNALVTNTTDDLSSNHIEIEPAAASEV